MKRPLLVVAAVLLLAGCTAAGAATSTTALHAGDTVMVTCDGSKGLAHTGTGARWVVSCRGTAPSSSPVSSPASSSASTSVPPSSTSPTPTDSGTPTTASSSPTIAPTGGCAASPSGCGFPDATNTGATGPVVNVPGQVTSGNGWHFDTRGWIEVDGTNAVFTGYTTTYGVDVSGSNVLISNDLITETGDGWGVSLSHASHVTISHVTITSPAASGPNRLEVGIGDKYLDSPGTVVDAVNISHTSTGVQMSDGLIEDSYIHDMGLASGDHINGTTSNSGGTSLVIRHNTIFNQIEQTDAVSLFEDSGTQRNATITGNLLAGGGYTIYGGANPGGAHTSNIVISNNRLSKIFYPSYGQYGWLTATDSGATISGNVDDTTGQPVS